MNRVWMIVWLAIGCAPAIEVEGATSEITGGVDVGTCGFPTTVLVEGCTGTLIHPRVIVTAAHCGSPQTAEFGERRGRGIRRSISCQAVPGNGVGSDVQFCVLDEPVQLPVTPILYGCELDRLVVNTDVVITGFGLTSFADQRSGGIQRWNTAPIRDVRSDITLIGVPSASACPGDSGGPVFIRLDDDSWRVFGSVSGGTTGIPCNGDGAYPRLERHVPWFEETFNIDITPCHDVDGTWNPGPECTGFFAGDHTGGQTWDNFCAGAPVSAPSTTCGPPSTPPVVDATVDAARDPDDASVNPPGDSGPDGAMADPPSAPPASSDGCGCTTASAQAAPLWAAAILLGWVVRRTLRRRRHPSNH